MIFGLIRFWTYALVLVSVTSGAWADEAVYRVNPDWITVACTDRNLMVALVAAAEWGDNAALNRLEAPARAHCVALEPNENITVTGGDRLFVQMRRAGDATEWWTSRSPLGWWFGEPNRNP